MRDKFMASLPKRSPRKEQFPFSLCCFNLALTVRAHRWCWALWQKKSGKFMILITKIFWELFWPLVFWVPAQYLQVMEVAPIYLSDSKCLFKVVTRICCADNCEAENCAVVLHLCSFYHVHLFFFCHSDVWVDEYGSYIDSVETLRDPRR